MNIDRQLGTRESHAWGDNSNDRIKLQNSKERGSQPSRINPYIFSKKKNSSLDLEISRFPYYLAPERIFREVINQLIGFNRARRGRLHSWRSFRSSHASWPSAIHQVWLFSGIQGCREICVFPVYLLRGHVACNRFSFHDPPPLATTTRIERRFRRISRFEWSFFFFFPFFFIYTVERRQGQLFFSILHAAGIIFFDEKWMRTGYESWKRRFIPFDGINPSLESMSF